MNPLNAISAVTQQNPYPYYDELREGPPLVFDHFLGLWIASRSQVISEVFSHPNCRVRPTAEPIPKSIVNTPAGVVFGNLVRMNEGVNHDQAKIALYRAFCAIDQATIQKTSKEMAILLFAQHRNQGRLDLSTWIVEFPIFVIGTLMGFRQTELSELVRWISDFVACFSPLSTLSQLEAASHAASTLLKRFKELIERPQGEENTLLHQVQREAQLTGWKKADSLLANLIGILSQTYDATAGLIGNSIVALHTQPRLQDEIQMTPCQVSSLVKEVSRFDPSIQNTRRFVTKETLIADVKLQPSDTILLVLAAANRDPAINPQPNQFLLERAQRRMFSFGSGSHACPGKTLAYSIATTAILELLTGQQLPNCGQLSWTYRPSVNARIPLFVKLSSSVKEAVL